MGGMKQTNANEWASAQGAAAKARGTRTVRDPMWAQLMLDNLSQGVFLVDPQQRVVSFNRRLCEMLDLPESLLASYPTLQEVVRFQRERGDFGTDLGLVESHARASIAADGLGKSPHYLRKTPTGRILGVSTQPLADGGFVRSFADLTDLVQFGGDVQRLNQLLQDVQSLARVGGWENDYASAQVHWTAGIYNMLETSPGEFVPTLFNVRRFFTAQALAQLDALEQGDGGSLVEHDLELEMITDRQRQIWVHSKVQIMCEHGRPIKWLAVLQDITERKLDQLALREAEERWKLALESTGDGVWDWYLQTGERFSSQRLREMYGYGESDQIDQLDVDALAHPEDRAQLQLDRQAHLDGLSPSLVNEHRVRCQDGSWKWVLTRGMVIRRDAQGQALRMIGTHTDITERKNVEALIWRQARFDPLTGLPNRRMLYDRLEQEIKNCRRDGLQLACLFIDLDHFKEVNDTLGHGRGDELLIEAARRLRQCVRECDTVARMGGDEFTVVLTEISDISAIEPILSKLLQTLATAYQLEDDVVHLSASMGITLYPADGTEIETLLKHADQALYAAKSAGRNRFSFFTPTMQEDALNRVRLLADLRRAMAEQQFHLVYQPIIDLSSGAVRKAEALIRWQHPQRGLVGPSEFIAAAEGSGLIVEIGEWVFEQAAQQVRRWRDLIDPQFQISVNRSPVQFHQGPSGSERSLARLRALDLPGSSVCIEITEGLLLDSSAPVVRQWLDLREAGVEVALDDFGTGYSSLSYLQRLSINLLKIDQLFVRHLTPTSTEFSLCRAIIMMAHELGMKVVAEGIETEQQRDLLVAAACDYGQGYWFARPMSAVDFEAFISQR